MGRALRSDYLICYVYLQVRFSSYSRDGHSSFGATVADDRLIDLGDRVPGDVVEDDVPGIGTLRNGVRDE